MALSPSGFFPELDTDYDRLFQDRWRPQRLLTYTVCEFSAGALTLGSRRFSNERLSLLSFLPYMGDFAHHRVCDSDARRKSSGPRSEVRGQVRSESQSDASVADARGHPGDSRKEILRSFVPRSGSETEGQSRAGSDQAARQELADHARHRAIADRPQ